jgi:hypothetical protein
MFLAGVVRRHGFPVAPTPGGRPRRGEAKPSNPTLSETSSLLLPFDGCATPFRLLAFAESHFVVRLFTGYQALPSKLPFLLEPVTVD